MNLSNNSNFDSRNTKVYINPMHRTDLDQHRTSGFMGESYPPAVQTTAALAAPTASKSLAVKPDQPYLYECQSLTNRISPTVYDNRLNSHFRSTTGFVNRYTIPRQTNLRQSTASPNRLTLRYSQIDPLNRVTSPTVATYHIPDPTNPMLFGSNLNQYSLNTPSKNQSSCALYRGPNQMLEEPDMWNIGSASEVYHTFYTTMKRSHTVPYDQGFISPSPSFSSPTNDYSNLCTLRTRYLPPKVLDLECTDSETTDNDTLSINTLSRGEHISKPISSRFYTNLNSSGDFGSTKTIVPNDPSDALVTSLKAVHWDQVTKNMECKDPSCTQTPKTDLPIYTTAKPSQLCDSTSYNKEQKLLFFNNYSLPKPNFPNFQPGGVNNIHTAFQTGSVSKDKVHESNTRELQVSSVSDTPNLGFDTLVIKCPEWPMQIQGSYSKLVNRNEVDKVDEKVGSQDNTVSTVCKPRRTKALSAKSKAILSPGEIDFLIESLEILCDSIAKSNVNLENILICNGSVLGSELSSPKFLSVATCLDPNNFSSINPRSSRNRLQSGKHGLNTKSEHRRRSGGSKQSDEGIQNRSEKVAVEVRVVFLKIGEIDTLKELYYADAFLQAKWREPLLDGRTTEELGITELEQYWNPLLYIDNILNETKESQWLVAQRNECGEVFLTERRRIKGVFLETLELNDFPLDVQDLTITVTTERPESEVDIIPDQVEMSAINVQTFVDQQEWILHEHVEITKRIIKQEYSSSMQSHPCLSVTCRAARRPGYFYWNVFLIMFMISGLAFATFAVSPDKAELRLRLSFTLILTSVTFKYVITQSLPKISYLTYMDKYVLMSLAILCIISVWHAVITLIGLDLDLPTTTAPIGSNYLKFIETNLHTNQSMGHRILTNYHNHSNSNSNKEHKPSTSIPIYQTHSNESKSQPQQRFDRNTSQTNESAFVKKEYGSCSKTNRMACADWKMVQRIEQHVFTSFVIIYMLAHAIFIFWLYFDASRRRREMQRKDKDYRLTNRPINQPVH